MAGEGGGEREGVTGSVCVLGGGGRADCWLRHQSCSIDSTNRQPESTTTTTGQAPRDQDDVNHIQTKEECFSDRQREVPQANIQQYTIFIYFF